MLRLFPADKLSEEDAILQRVQQGERVAHFDTERLHKDGTRIAVAVTISPVVSGDGQITGASMIARDITRQKALEAELRSLAFHDALTRLPNRRLLLDRLRHAQENSRRQQSHAAVLFVDLDHFKQLNDTHGHDVGDQLLIELGQRLRDGVRESDTVARLGGDEFVVLCENLGPDPEAARHSVLSMMDKLSQVVAQPCRVSGQTQHCSASMGYRLFLGTQDDPDQLIHDADVSMYHQKEEHHSSSGPFGT
jgi:diguanylate cyclase (GGDEF)-like protein